MQLFELQAKLASFIRGGKGAQKTTLFLLCLKEWSTCKLQLFRLGYLADSSFKMYEMNLSHEVKQLIVFVANGPILAYLKFWKT